MPWVIYACIALIVNTLGTVILLEAALDQESSSLDKGRLCFKKKSLAVWLCDKTPLIERIYIRSLCQLFWCTFALLPIWTILIVIITIVLVIGTIMFLVSNGALILYCIGAFCLGYDIDYVEWIEYLDIESVPYVKLEPHTSLLRLFATGTVLMLAMATITGDISQVTSPRLAMAAQSAYTLLVLAATLLIFRYAFKSQRSEEKARISPTKEIIKSYKSKVCPLVEFS